MAMRYALISLFFLAFFTKSEAQASEYGTLTSFRAQIPYGSSALHVVFSRPTMATPLQVMYEPDIDCNGGLLVAMDALYEGDKRWYKIASSNGYFLTAQFPIEEILFLFEQKTMTPYQNCVLRLDSPSITNPPLEVPTKVLSINFQGVPGTYENILPLPLPYYAKRVELVMPLCLGLEILDVTLKRRSEALVTTKTSSDPVIFELPQPRVFDFVSITYRASSDVPVCDIQVYVYDRAP